MKSKKITAFLAFFFGMIGVHRFYLNQRFRGIIYFASSVLMMILSVEEEAPFILIPALVVLIDAILFTVMPKEEFDAKYNKNYQTTTYAAPRPRRGFRRPDRPLAFAAAPAPPPMPRAKKRENPFKKSGIAKYKDYDYEGAIEDFQKALRFKYEDPAVHFNIACCYSINEDVDQAMFHLDKAMEFGFVQLDRVHDHPALAFTRTTEVFETFVKQGYRLTPQAASIASQPAQAVEEIEVDLPQAVTSEQATPLPGLLDQISRLGELKEKGVLTEEEFEAQKQRILGE